MTELYDSESDFSTRNVRLRTILRRQRLPIGTSFLSEFRESLNHINFAFFKGVLEPAVARRFRAVNFLQTPNGEKRMFQVEREIPK